MTTSPTGTPTSSAGVLPGATILYPTSDVNGGARPGGRFTGGFWCDECQSTGFDASFFILTTPYHNYSANSSATGSPILARPFYNTALPGEDAALISYPGLYSGNASITTTYKLSGGDVNFRKLMARTKFSNFYFLMGYRYLSFDTRC